MSRSAYPVKPRRTFHPIPPPFFAIRRPSSEFHSRTVPFISYWITWTLGHDAIGSDALPCRGGTLVETAVPGGFRHMLGLDPFAARQIRDGAGHLEKPVVGPVAESQPGENVQQQPFRSRRQYRVTFQHPARKLAVPSNARPFVPLPLDFVCFCDQLPGFRGRYPAAPVILGPGRTFLLRQLHLKVDAVQERPGNPRAVPQNGTFRTGARLAGRVIPPVSSAGTTVQITTLEITPFSIRLPFSQSHLGRQ